jgi:lipopolysaccharide export LptBFGC system permease protein LptF
MFKNIDNTFTKNNIEVLHLDPSTREEEAMKKLEFFFSTTILLQNDSEFEKIYGLSKDEFFNNYGFVPGEEIDKENNSTDENEKDSKNKKILRAQLNSKIAHVKSMMAMGSAFPLTKEEYLVNMKKDLNSLVEQLNSLDETNDINNSNF